MPLATKFLKAAGVTQVQIGLAYELQEQDRLERDRERKRKERAAVRAVRDVRGRVGHFGQAPPIYKNLTDRVEKVERPVWGVSAKRRSKRVPTDFKLAEADIKFAIDHNVDPQSVFPEFCDHEFANPRSDWHATWRNWVRRAVKFNGKSNGGTHGRQKVETVEERGERLKQRIREAEQPGGSLFGTPLASRSNGSCD